jgi:FkbM family methyltransferase
VDEDLLPLSWATEVIGFEPDPDALSRMLDSPDRRWKGVQVLPYAIGGASGDAILYVPESPQGASLLPHNNEMVDRFGYPNLHIDVEQIPVRTKSLDALKESGQLPRIDYIKIDVEGAELSILESGGLLLQDCSALKVEGSFLEQRVGQPLVWEVAQRIIDSGFEIVELHDIHRWRRRNLRSKSGMT